MSTPLYLYKYQSVTQHSLLSLINGTVWMSSPTSFNDPFDCAINLDIKKLEESIAHAVELVAKTQNVPVDESLRAQRPDDEAAYATLRESLGAHMQKIGVLCLSETPSEILMWSHYAEHHKGFCIEYRIGETSSLRTMAHPVKYTDEYPSLSLKNLPVEAEENFINVCVHTKASQWSYEKEWRAIMPVGGRLYKAPAPVSAIIFGACMSDIDKKYIYQVLQLAPSIEFREAYLLENVFGIGFRPYTP
ncbi:DUF2971 domain-containing protein [Pseudomonas gingeri]|uniref:DUF2971 domain-containing protein n=1 Tax=Pseudomonas gingeri TaxID=117681 RepID=UPI0015A3D642|nr:DUF2971 domain-containing protein [Pseudomonas gingeri]NWD71172.1 DUF2971 domain-containing protein [Pseudomonas gingeri]